MAGSARRDVQEPEESSGHAHPARRTPLSLDRLPDRRDTDRPAIRSDRSRQGDRHRASVVSGLDRARRPSPQARRVARGPSRLVAPARARRDHRHAWPGRSLLPQELWRGQCALKDDAEMSADLSPGDATRCARAAAPAASVSRPLVPSLDLSVFYEIADLDQIDGLNTGRLSGFSYARDGHPNAVQLAAKMCAIERAAAGLVCASGMAAIASTLLTLVSQGDHVIISEGLYGKSTTLVSRELVRFGVTHDSFDPASPDSLETLITSRTRLVLVETISNPLLRVSDLEAIARLARGAEVPLMVDHTFAPLLCRPIELGATFVMHSVTKLIGGHSDLTLGVVVGPRTAIDRIRSVASTFGLTGNPFESWLALRGLATLSLRSDRASATALDLAARLEAHPQVTRVVPQPIMPLDLPVKVRPWELTVYPRSHIRRWLGVTRPAKARM